MTKEEFENRIIAMQDTLYRVSCTVLSQPCDREDAVSEAVLRALTKREKLRDDRFMQTWVIRILLNECYGILRKNKKICPAENLPPPKREKDADPQVFEALFSLDTKYRLPMVLYYVENYSAKETAAILHLPEGTVRSRLDRGRKKIKAMLEKEEND